MDIETKITQELEEIHALELALVQTLGAHIGMTPHGEYRDGLERHLGDTRRQAERIRSRLRALGVRRGPVTLAYGVVQTVAGQAVAAAKAPIDVLRGTSGAEKLLKNVKDEISSEALEIASYDGLEALAGEAGDEPTARLAREHREQEERMMVQLRELIPKLTAAVIAEDVRGERVVDPSTVGAADAARKAGASAVDAARSVPGSATVEGQARGAAADASDLPIARYDDLTVKELLPKVDKLSQEKLAEVDAYERRHRSRKQVLERIQRRREPTATSR